jgi:thermitase
MKIRGAVHISVVSALIIAVSLSANASTRFIGSPGYVSGIKTEQVSSKITNTPGSNAADPFLNKQWALEKIHISALQDITAGISGPLVAILDTGIDRNHPDLEGNVVAEVNFTDSPTVNDRNGHGTHVAGIIAANTDNGIGVAGVAPQSRLMNVKVAGDDGICRAATVARGIVWAADNGAKIINVSLEMGPSAELEQAVKYAWNKGAIIIAAAGNSASSKPVYPAYYVNCIAAAGTSQDDDLAPLSNYGDWVDIAAPGFLIFSTLPGEKYGYENGTSSAAAYVSGIAALLMCTVIDTNGNGRTNDEVRAIIESSGQKIDIDGMGSGRIDAAICAEKVGNLK